MSRLKQQRGFTIVEVVIALAISGLLLTIAITGRSSQRNDAQYASIIDGIKNNLNSQNNQAQQGIQQPISPHTNTSGQFGKSDVTVFGKLVEFRASAPDTYSSWTLIQNADGTGNLRKCDKETISFGNGIQYRGASDANGTPTSPALNDQDIIYTKDPAQVFVSPPSNPIVETATGAPSCDPTALVTPPPPAPIPPPDPCTVPGPTARDCQRIADLQSASGIHSRLVAFASAHSGQLPMPAAYGDLDVGGIYDYSAQSGVPDSFLSFLGAPGFQDPLHNGSGDVFTTGAGFAYAYTCFDSTAPLAQQNTVAIGVKLEQPANYAGPNLKGNIYWYSPVVYEKNIVPGFTCKNFVPGPPQPTAIDVTSAEFPAWHMYNTGGVTQKASFKLTNPAASTSPVHLKPPAYSGPNANSFSTYTNNCPAALNPGAFCTVVVQFFPPSGDANNRLSNAGRKTATVTFGNTDGVTPVPTAALGGWAVTDRMGPDDRMYLTGDDNDNAARGLRGYNAACYNNAFACSSLYVMWSNGNVVDYSDAISGAVQCLTGATSGTQLLMQGGDGNLVLYDNAFNPILAAGAADPNDWIMLFSDGQIWRFYPAWNAGNYAFRDRLC